MDAIGSGGSIPFFVERVSGLALSPGSWSNTALRLDQRGIDDRLARETHPMGPQQLSRLGEQGHARFVFFQKMAKMEQGRGIRHMSSLAGSLRVFTYTFTS
jgi:hypothetical protein